MYNMRLLRVIYWFDHVIFQDKVFKLKWFHTLLNSSIIYWNRTLQFLCYFMFLKIRSLLRFDFVFDVFLSNHICRRVSIYLSFRHSRETANMSVCTFIEDLHSCCSMALIICLFFSNIFIWNIESSLPDPYYFEYL